jgi:hypothetical protein
VILRESATSTANDLPSEIKASARSDSSFTIHLGSSVREVVDELIGARSHTPAATKSALRRFWESAAARFTADLNTTMGTKRTAA